jgi:hypothetical protein
LFAAAAPASSGGHVLSVVAALVVGLLAGFGAGFLAGQQGEPIPAPPSAATAAVPVPTTAAQPQVYTDAPVDDADRRAPEDGPRPTQEVAPAPVGAVPVAVRATQKSEPGPPRPIAAGSPGSLQIASRPAGAQVYLDDVRVGVTPTSLAAVSAGAHRVRIELAGFRRWATTVNVESGARARIGASLER